MPSTLVDAIVDLMDEPAKCRALLDKLLGANATEFNDQVSNQAFKLLLRICDDMQPTEVIAYLNQRDELGSTIAMQLDVENYSQYGALLRRLIDRGLPAQDVVDHLAIRDYTDNDNVLQIHGTNEDINGYIDLLIFLKQQNINMHSFACLLTNKNNQNQSVLTEMDSMLNDDIGSFFRLISEGVITKEHWGLFSDWLEDVVAHIDTLYAAEKTGAKHDLKNPAHPLHQFVIFAAKQRAKSLIKQTTLHYNRDEKKAAALKERKEFLQWLHDVDLPATMKMAALNVKNNVARGSRVKHSLAGCLTLAETPIFLDLLKSLLNQIAPENLLKQVKLLKPANSNSAYHLPANYVNLLTKLILSDIPAKEVEPYAHVIIKTGSDSGDVSDDKLREFITFLETVLAKDVATFKKFDLANLGYYVIKSQDDEIKRAYIRLLNDYAKKNKKCAEAVVNTLSTKYYAGYCIKNIAYGLFSTKPGLQLSAGLLSTLSAAGVDKSKTLAVLTFIRAGMPKTVASILTEHANTDMPALYQFVRYNVLPEEHRRELRRHKEKLLAHINGLPIQSRLAGLLEATLPSYSLCKFFGYQRGILPTRSHAGVYSAINKTIIELLYTKEGIRAYKELIAENGKEVEVKLKATILSLARDKPKLLLRLVKHHAIAEEEFSQIFTGTKAHLLLIAHINMASPRNQMSLLSLYIDHDSAVSKFLRSHEDVRLHMDKLVKETFGDQQQIATTIEQQQTVRAVEQSAHEARAPRAWTYVPAPVKQHVVDPQSITYAAQHLPHISETLYGQPLLPPPRSPEAEPEATEQPAVEVPPPPYEETASKPVESRQALYARLLKAAPPAPSDSFGEQTTEAEPKREALLA